MSERQIIRVKAIRQKQINMKAVHGLLANDALTPSEAAAWFRDVDAAMSLAAQVQLAETIKVLAQRGRRQALTGMVEDALVKPMARLSEQIGGAERAL